MNRQKWIPLGVEDFKEVATTCYYVDKTALIAKIIDSPSGSAFLFTRPRRFGKSLAISMLAHFYSEKEDSRELFAPFAISHLEKGAFLSELNRYPVIHLNLKNVDSPTYEGMLRSLSSLMADLYDSLLKEDDPAFSASSLRFIQTILRKEASEEELATCLLKLCRFLQERSKKKAILLIDEYDAPMLNALPHGYQEKASSFFKTFLGAALKGNDSLEKAVITGVLQIAKASIFSGLNNLLVDDGLQEDSEFFAFTSQEVVELLAYYGKEEEEEKVWEWYGGYLFSAEPCYCPWSVLSYLKNACHFRAYWTFTSANRLLPYAKGIDLENTLSSLLSGKAVYIDLERNLSFQNLREENSFLSLLFYSGYLRAEEGIVRGNYRLSIPNKEIEKALCEDVIQTYGNGSFRLLSELKEGFLHGDAQGVEDVLKRYLLAFSYFDYSDERAYSILVTTLAALLFEDAYVKSEVPFGEGRSDLAILSKKEKGFALLLEFKSCGIRTRNDALAKLAKNAIQQMEERDYAAEAKSLGKSPILLFGVAFAGKKVVVESKQVG